MRKTYSTIAIVAASLMMLVAIGYSTRDSAVFAQAVISAPGAPQSLSGSSNSNSAPAALSPLPNVPPPPNAPAGAAPGAPAALGTASALPQLAPAPAIVRAAPASTPGVFRCSCFGLGSGTRWIGEVTAPNFTQASQSAQAQCTSLLFNENPPSPYIPPPGSNFTTRSGYPPVNPNLPPGNVFSQNTSSVFTERSAASSGRASASIYCARCACN